MKRNLTELKRLARETLAGHYGRPMLGIVITSMISNLLLMPFSPTSNNSTSQSVIFYAASFIIALLMVLFSCGLCYMHLNMRRNKPYELKNIFYFFTDHPDRLLLSYLLLTGISLLIFLPAILVAIGAFYLDKSFLYLVATLTGIVFLLLALPVLYGYSLLFFLLIDHPEMKIREAMKESRRLMKGNKMRLFLLHLSFIGWAILGVCSCFVGFLWIEPYFEQTTVSFYFELTGENDRLEEQKAADAKNESDKSHFQAYC